MLNRSTKFKPRKEKKSSITKKTHFYARLRPKVFFPLQRHYALAMGMHLLNKLWPRDVCNQTLSERYLSTTASQTCCFHVLNIPMFQLFLYVLCEQLFVCICDVCWVIVSTFSALPSLDQKCVYLWIFPEVRQLYFKRASSLRIAWRARFNNCCNIKLSEGQILLRGGRSGPSPPPACFLFLFKMITADI